MCVKLLLLVAVIGPGQLPIRTWCNTSHGLKLPGNLVAADKSRIVIQHESGYLITIPRTMLPAADVEYLRQREVPKNPPREPWFGMLPVTLTAEVGQIIEKHLGEKPRPKKGVVLKDVIDGSPAAKSGLQPLDIVTVLDGKLVSAAPEFAKMLDQHKPGDTVRLTAWRYVRRRWRSATIAVTAGSRPTWDARNSPLIVAAGITKDILDNPKLLIKVQNLSPFPVVAFKMTTRSFNRFNEPVSAIFGDEKDRLIAQSTIEPGETSDFAYTMYLREAVGKVELKLDAVRFEHGGEWQPQPNAKPIAVAELIED